MKKPIQKVKQKKIQNRIKDKSSKINVQNCPFQYFINLLSIMEHSGLEICKPTF
ncbi:MAG: hypothetical protein RLZZ628_788 [Bacteroidota bacterium]|jgi:UDP-N-acetylglucosamine:LPS N-acetylglucosamine transferase